MRKFLQLLFPRPLPAEPPDWPRLYRLNHIGQTFGISVEQFSANPWGYLGRPSPDIEALWNREHSLLPAQATVAVAVSSGTGLRKAA